MAGTITKLVVGALLLGLVITSGLSFLVLTANDNGYTSTDFENYDNNLANQTVEMRNIVYNASSDFEGADIEEGSSDTSQVGSILEAGERGLSTSIVLRSFLTDFASLFNLNSSFIIIIASILGMILFSAGVYLFTARTP